MQGGEAQDERFVELGMEDTEVEETLRPDFDLADVFRRTQ